jgi:hypothetical protein
MKVRKGDEEEEEEGKQEEEGERNMYGCFQGTQCPCMGN